MALKLSDLPEVSFAEKDIEKILNEMISGYEQAYFEQYGVRKILYPGDPIRVWLYSQALREFQLRVMIDDAAKQNLLKYSRESFLENLGAFSRTTRFEATASRVKMKFNLSVVRPTPETIPTGTRVSPGGEIYFANAEGVVVPAGALTVELETICLQVGEIGNGFTPGQINILVDPLPWIASVENVEISQGGIERENDDSYRERVHLAPEGFSAAGPEGAYEHFTKQYSALIQDIRVSSPTPGAVDVRVLLQNGELPTQLFLDGLKEHLSAKDKRPLTDNLQTAAPGTNSYNLDVTYYIKSSDVAKEELIKQKVNQAIDDYILWQRSKIGRDVTPDELNALIRIAGAKRSVITAPVFTAIGANDLAVIGTKTVTYGGLEDE